MGQVHAQDLVAGLEDREVGRHVGLRARMRLDVDVLGAGEEGQRAILGQPLGDVHELAAAVVALAGQALGVLVGERRTLRLHHRGEGVVLAGDHLDLPALAIGLAANGRPQLGVDIGQPGPGDPFSTCDRHRWLLPGLAPDRRGCRRYPLKAHAIDLVASIVADQTWRRLRQPVRRAAESEAWPSAPALPTGSPREPCSQHRDQGSKPDVTPDLGATPATEPASSDRRRGQSPRPPTSSASPGDAVSRNPADLRCQSGADAQSCSHHLGKGLASTGAGLPEKAVCHLALDLTIRLRPVP